MVRPLKLTSADNIIDQGAAKAVGSVRRVVRAASRSPAALTPRPRDRKASDKQ
jgi:hypothetical protein